MSHQRVESGQGWTWITQGWEIFMKNPGIWIVLALILFVINFVLNWIPFLGWLAASLLGPAFFGGLVYGARELDHDRSLEIPHLFQAFRDSDRTVPMVLLGLVPLAVSILLGIFAAIFIAGVAGTAAITGSGGATAGVAFGGGLIFFLLAVLGALVNGALLLFSVPRVMFGHVEPFTGVKESLQAVMANMGAFLVLVLIFIVFAILAIIPFGLGFLLLMPVMAGAVYSANKQVFGPADPTDQMPSSGAGEAPGGAGEEPAAPDPSQDETTRRDDTD